MKRAAFLYLLVTISIGGGVWAQDDPCASGQQEAKGMDMVRKELGGHELGGYKSTLVAVRLPELTDVGLDLKVSDGISARPICFYRVVYATHMLDGNKAIGEHIELDGHTEWIAAVDPENGRGLLVEGVKDPVAEFNRLAGLMHLTAKDADAAKDVFDFFLRVAGGQEYRSSVVSDEMGLESLALADFRMRLSHKQSRTAFDKWWNSIPAGVKSALSYPKATPIASGGFEVRYFSYHEGTVSRRAVTVHQDGTVALREPKVIVASK